MIKINKNLSKTIGLFLKQHAPQILSVLGCAGVVGTAVVAVRQDRKARQTIQNIETELIKNTLTPDNAEDWRVSKDDKRTIYIKEHIPTALMSVTTMFCIIGSGYLSKQTQVGMIAAYGLLNESFGDYRRKNIELYGAENHKKILESLAIERSKPMDLYCQGAFSCPSLNAVAIARDYPKELFYDEFSKRYFESTLPAVLEAQYHLNRNIALGTPVLLNEYYGFLGLEDTIPGNELGWYMCDDYMWVDFNNEERYLEDGTRYIAIQMEYEPTTDWQQEW